MGDDPNKHKGADTTGDAGGLHRQAVTLLAAPPRPGDSKVGAPGPAGQTQPAASELNPADKAVKDITAHQTAAITAAKAQDTPTADKELKAARDLADGSQRRADQLLAQFNQRKDSTRQTLAKEFGIDASIDPTKVAAQFKDIETKLRSGTLTDAQRQRLEQLGALEKELYGIQQLKEAPAITRAQSAYMKASGALEAPDSATPEEKLRVSQQNASDAMMLMRDGLRRDNNGELANSPQFEAIRTVVTKRYNDYQTELAGTTLGALGTAEQLLKDPTAQNDPVKKAQVDAQYEAAYSAASRLDMAYIQAHQDVLGAHGKEPAQLDLQEVSLVRTAAMFRKAQMLIDGGKFSDALPLMTKLQVEAPGVETDPNFKAMMRKAFAGDTGADMKQHFGAVQDILDRHDDHKLTDDEKKRKYGAALAELDASLTAIGKRNDQLNKGLQALQLEQNDVTRQLRELDSRNLDQTERKIETDRLNKEMDIVKEQMLLLNQGLAYDKATVADFAYLQGYSHFMVGDLAEAHERFQFAKDNDSKYAKNPEAKLDDLIHATNWWSRHNWLKSGIIVVAGVTAGIIAGALLIETGPGAAAAGYLVANGIIDAGAATTVAVGVNSVLWGGTAGAIATDGATAAFGDPVTLSTTVRGFGYGAGGAAFNLVRAASAPAVVAPDSLLRIRLIAGMAAGGTYGVTSGVPGFIADKIDGVPTMTAAGNFGSHVALNAVFGAFTPIKSFRANLGEVPLNNAWRAKVLPSLVGAGPILINPTLEGFALQSGPAVIADMTHRPHLPRIDHMQEHHDFSKDTDLIDELSDPTVAQPRRPR